MERKDPDRADPITRLIARRVHEIRGERGMSGAALGAAVRALGLTRWVASTVGKLETNRRQSVTVREWLALSLALRVPPVWLLIDPKGDSVPVADGIDVDAWTAVLWLAGRQPLAEPPGPAWDDAAEMIWQVYQVAGAVKAFRQSRQYYKDVAAFLPDSDREQERALADEHDSRILASLVSPLRELGRSGAPLPPLPEDVLKRASELDVELPGWHEGAS